MRGPGMGLDRVQLGISISVYDIYIYILFIYYLYTIYIWRARKILDFLSFAAGFGFIFGSWFYAFLFLLFSDSLLFCFSAFLLLCFSAFCFPCFSAFPASLLFCFLLSFAFLLLCSPCFSASYFYYSTFSFLLQSCVFNALLPAPLLLCFLSFLSLCFSFSFALYILFCLSR